jgi:hypothetical protein
LINGREAVREKVKWGTKGVIPLGIEVCHQLILKADQEVRPVMRFFARTPAFSLLDIFGGIDSVWTFV